MYSIRSCITHSVQDIVIVNCRNQQLGSSHVCFRSREPFLPGSISGLLITWMNSTALVFACFGAVSLLVNVVAVVFSLTVPPDGGQEEEEEEKEVRVLSTHFQL